MRENELMFGFPKRLNDQMGVGFPSGPYLLDQFPGAAAAYSVRRLSSTYTGPCMRVRNADNVEKDIYFDANGLVSEAELRVHCCPGPNELPNSDSLSSFALTGVTRATASITDPFGGSSVSQFSETATTSTHTIIYGLSVPTGNTYCFSVYVKKATGSSAPDIIQMAFNTPYANFNISTGQITFSTGLTATITDVGNGWYRCGIKVTLTGPASSFTISFCNNNPTSTRIPSYAGSTNSDIYLFGAQITASDEQLPYVKTTSVYTLSSGWITKWYDQTNTPVLGNMLARSQALQTAPWTASGVTMANNAATFPYTNEGDGTRATTTATTHDVYQEVSVSPSTNYNFSFWFLRGTMTDVKYSVYDVTNSADIIAPTSYYSNALGGWTRVEIRFTTPSNCTTIRVSPLKNSDVTGTAFYWGAQLTKTTAMQPYTPTTVTGVTQEKRDLYQDTAASQPVIVSSGVINKVNKFTCPFFTGTTDFVAYLHGTTVATHFHVMNMTARGVNLLNGGTNKNNTANYYGTISSDGSGNLTSNTSGTPRYFQKENQVYRIIPRGNFIVTVTNLNTYQWYLIYFQTGVGGVSYRHELIMYNSDMSNTRQAIENNINSFYGIY